MFDKIKIFFKESFKEIKKTNWPNKNETWRYTLLVLLFTFIMAVYLGLLDAGFGYILSKVIR